MIKKEEDLEPDVGQFDFYIFAFKELNSTRNDARNPIPMGALLDYHRLYPEVGELEEFMYFIRLMDDTLIKLESNKKESGDKK
jgi:hypothetical protein